jgi:hypothetical protein
MTLQPSVAHWNTLPENQIDNLITLVHGTWGQGPRLLMMNPVLAAVFFRNYLVRLFFRLLCGRDAIATLIDLPPPIS